MLLPRLLAPYLHMTNNRLGASLLDEVYLAHLLTRTVREHLRPADAAAES